MEAFHVIEAGRAYGGFARTERVFVEPAAEVRYLPTPEEVWHSARIVLAALYLPGAPRGIEVSARCWPEVLRLLRSEGASLGTAQRLLARRGFPAEALALSSPRLLSWVEGHVGSGRVLTAADQAYPLGWRRRLAAAAPPALWRAGTMPAGPLLAVVGSRRIPAEARRFALGVGETASELGYAVVSGGAAGCDRAAVEGALRAGGEAVDVLPCGVGVASRRPGVCRLSPWAPEEDFSGPNAMRRNALIYAAAGAAVLVQARLGEGGTWKGAVEAVRRRLCPLIVRDVPGDPASRALQSLGAAPLSRLADLGDTLDALRRPDGLFLENP